MRCRISVLPMRPCCLCVQILMADISLYITPMCKLMVDAMLVE